jgi:inorganic pyrophosphatase
MKKPLEYIEIKLCQLQAKIFEASVKNTRYSSLVFIKRFMFSDVAKTFDNKSYLFQSNTINDVFVMLDEEYGETTYGKNKYTQDQMFWIGYIYRCLSIKYNITSKQVYKLFNAEEIVKYYNIYHTFDIVQAANRMMENIGYEEENIEEKAYNIMKKYIYREKAYALLNESIKVFIDRPIGSHHPKHKNLIYKQNYGYIKELKALDGEYQDAYVIGIDEKITEFYGKVIAIINRKNDIEDKLIVCDINKNYTDEEIKEFVHFQEQYFDYKIIR